MTKHQEGWPEFTELCQKMKSENNYTELFEILLTPQEKESIAMRCLIIRELLKKEKTQREIAKHLKVSIAKITRGSNELKRASLPFLKYLKSILL